MGKITLLRMPPGHGVVGKLSVSSLGSMQGLMVLPWKLGPVQGEKLSFKDQMDQKPGLCLPLRTCVATIAALHLATKASRGAACCIASEHSEAWLEGSNGFRTRSRIVYGDASCVRALLAALSSKNHEEAMWWMMFGSGSGVTQGSRIALTLE